MSYAQAFHTSCRSGLSGISGFQINAASDVLDRHQLSAMTAMHARYDAPRDLPYEPTPEEMGAFPVALRMSVVPGVGPVVSRTAYVGREYRGRNGEPDEGRFGNFFCHMVVGAPGDGDAFGGLSAVELWDAPHWTTTEAEGTVLPELVTLEPGPLDLGGVVAAVDGAPAGVAAALLDAAFAATSGGRPVLVVDPDADRAVMWVAWLTFALPPAVASALSFSTFEGRPQDVLDLDVVVTAPACDPGPVAAARFERVAVTEAVEGASSLYARAAARLAADGAEALAGAVRRVGAGSVQDQGAQLAIAGRVLDLVADFEVPVVLEAVAGLARADRTEDAAAAATALAPSAVGDATSLTTWAELHRLGRTASGQAARDLATVALGRLVAHVDELPGDLRAVGHDAPTPPGVGSIGAWLRACEAARGTAAAGRRVALGLRLGLIGVNAPVDGRVAALVAADAGRPAMDDAAASLAASGAFDHVLERATLLLVDGDDPEARHRLLALARHAVVRRTVRRWAEAEGTFDAHLIWQTLRIATGTPRAEAATALARQAPDDRAYADLRRLWGPDGPTTAQETVELLDVYRDAGRRAPADDVDRAFALLMRAPLPTGAPPEGHLAHALGRLPRDQRNRGAFHALYVVAAPPADADGLDRWADFAIAALAAPAEEVPAPRREEVVRAVARTLVRFRNEPTFPALLAEFRAVVTANALATAMGRAVATLLESAVDPVDFAAREFSFWLRSVPGAPERVLPVAFEALSAKDVDRVADRLPETDVERWQEWCARYPRRKGRRFGLGRGERV